MLKKRQHCSDEILKIHICCIADVYGQDCQLKLEGFTNGLSTDFGLLIPSQLRTKFPAPDVDIRLLTFCHSTFDVM